MRNERSGIISPRDQGLRWNITEGRSVNLRLFGAQTGETLAVFEETVPVGTETLLHLHRDSDEAIYVLEGEIGVRIKERVERGGAGTWVFIPRQTAHAWKNVGGGPARAIFMFTPARAARFFEELSQQSAPINELNPAAITALLHQSGWEILGPSAL